jgi:ferritin-like metal-binding protein YciE
LQSTHDQPLSIDFVPAQAELNPQRPRCPRETATANAGGELPEAGIRSFTVRERSQPMGIFSKDIKTMDDLFLHTLQDIFYAEERIEKALPKMISKATNGNLVGALTSHLDETHQHVTRLHEVFRMLGAKAKEVDCPAIDGILKEANEIVGEVDDPSVLDAAIIAAGQAVEHYEMSRYGTLVAWARRLGRDDCAAILEETLEEEKNADKTLTEVAEASVNKEAVAT